MTGLKGGRGTQGQAVSSKPSGQITTSQNVSFFIITLFWCVKSVILECFVTCNKHSSIIIISKIKVHLIRRVFFPQGSPGFPGLPGGVGPHGPLVSYILTLKLPKIKIHTICC